MIAVKSAEGFLDPLVEPWKSGHPDHAIALVNLPIRGASCPLMRTHPAPCHQTAAAWRETHEPGKQRDDRAGIVEIAVSGTPVDTEQY